ncbi:MAG: sigma 54-interacting transcriptional regulator, partial [Bacteroidota bacterium]
NKNIIRIGILIITFLFILLFKDVNDKINSNVESAFYSLNSSSLPDTNIVLIKITQSDIEKLGGWPLKRSYYALLLNKLLDLNAAKIGLEIFLSTSNRTQNIYNDLILNELKKNDKITLSCYANSIENEAGQFYTDSIIYPLSESEFKIINIGHVNYLEFDDIYIPQEIFYNKDTLPSFSKLLTNEFENKGTIPQFLKLNFHSSLNDFNSFDLIEFFDLLERNDPRLNFIKGKIVLIGVTDPNIGKSVVTLFDKTFPGIGLHATAVDNILTQRFLDPKYRTQSTIVFVLLMILIIFITGRFRLIFYPIILLVLLILSFLLFTQLYIELDYSAFLLPIFLLFIGEILFYIFEKEQRLSEAYSENEILERTVSLKEKTLIELEKEINESKEPPKHLLDQVDTLKEQVDQLRKSQRDNETIFQSEDDDSTKNFLGIIYRSSEMQKLADMVTRIAPTDASVLVIGESGSGKELVANAIHQLSKRKNNSYVAFNCAALPENLLESELFGHVKGAFTDASSNKIGRFEAADNGTIFLDEIGETSERFQAKLLRVLQTGELQKVGSSETKIVDVRVIAATNKNLTELVKENQFREDLYYRLNVITIEVPSLSERTVDIAILAEYFTEKENAELKISNAVMNILLKNEWTGNVRELESTIKRAAIFALSDNRNIIKIIDLPSNLANLDKSNLEQMILDSLREKDFSHSAINETAKELGNISRTIISENFRGIFFQNYVQNNFDLETACKNIVDSENEDAHEKVRKKGQTYLKNLETDIKNIGSSNFDELKNKFSSKYKNLPQKYHTYLDEVIKHLI